MIDVVHERLPCGIEYGVIPLPRRHVVSIQIMVLAGTSSEPADKLGLAHILGETLDKGSTEHSGRELSDAFDEIGASHRIGVGRESTTFSCTVLPEHFERAIELHAEIIRKPTFPDDAFTVNVELTRQELKALEDDAHGLLDKLMNPQAFGAILGRHPLGEPESLDALRLKDLSDHWTNHFAAGTMVVSVAGAVSSEQVADVLEKYFGGFNSPKPAGRSPFPADFFPGRIHHDKKLEQEQIAVCWPGASVTQPDFPIQQVLLGVLSGGMSGRLFTEIREKQGLVYWVGAWQDTPRGTGRIFLGASTTPQRCDKTFTTLLREVERLADDIEQDELERAVTGIVAHHETRGDITRARCGELADDLFHYGHPVDAQEKLGRIKAVTIHDIKRYLAEYPREELCVMTLGPEPLTV